jgi:polysaccharide deacetylase family protein (PEP-CTERM system associated)
VENFKPHIPYYTWESCELRVERNTHRLLDLFDDFSVKPKATFFILGWIAKRLPSLVKIISTRGHEVASHGNNHQLCNKLGQEGLKNDLFSSKKRLEDITGNEVKGFRAPSFAINDRVVQAIEKCGYRYDSSFNSFNLHSRYGSITHSNETENGIAVKVSDNFYELPISNLLVNKWVLPWGGGAYFRLIPFNIFKAGMKRILNSKKSYLFYLHPWEIDPRQPEVASASKLSKFRHYTNLKLTYDKLKKMIHSFDNSRFITCSQYLDQSGVF